MDDWHWSGMMFFPWFWMIAIWLVFLVIAIIVYRDAVERGMNGLLWFFLLLIPIPPLQVVILIIYLIVREESTRSSRYPQGPQKSASTILDERFARGEITREEYIKMKDALKKDGS